VVLDAAVPEPGFGGGPGPYRDRDERQEAQSDRPGREPAAAEDLEGAAEDHEAEQGQDDELQAQSVVDAGVSGEHASDDAASSPAGVSGMTPGEP
jgi:hypothetical protein